MAEKKAAGGGGAGGGAGASPSPAAGHTGHAASALANPKPKKRTRTSSRGSVEALTQSTTALNKNSTASATTTTTGKENELSKESNAASTPLSPQLMALMERKEILERVLENLETQIYALETSYLEDTHSRGNIVRGWESFRARRGAVSHKRVRVSDKNRIFSLSSATAYKVVGTAAFPCKDEDDDKAKDTSPHTHHVDNHL